MVNDAVRRRLVGKELKSYLSQGVLLGVDHEQFGVPSYDRLEVRLIGEAPPHQLHGISIFFTEVCYGSLLDPWSPLLSIAVYLLLLSVL